MNLYNSYCYANMSEITDVIQSTPVLSDGSIITNVTSIGSTVTITKNALSTFDFTLPTCTQLGFNQTYLGISFVDSQELAWLVVFVLVSAFAIKILKRGL